MPDRPQQLRVHARQPRQGLRIQPIILPAAGADQLHLSGIRHDHLVPKAAQQPAYPRRMCPHFDRDPTLWQVTKPLFHPFLSRRHGAFAHHLSLAVQHIIVTGLVSQVHADRNRSLAGFAPLRTLQTSAILLHGRFSFFAPRVRIHWELIASRWGPAFSFHLGFSCVPRCFPLLRRTPSQEVRSWRQSAVSWYRAATANEDLLPRRHGRLLRSEERRVGKECRSRWSP